jgi:hypothetical protein
VTAEPPATDPPQPAAPDPPSILLPATAPGAVDAATRIRRLEGWRGAFALLAIVLGIPLIAGVLAEDAIGTPAAEIELDGRITVPTVHGWELVDQQATNATWLRGDSQLYVEVVDFSGSSAELIAGLDRDVASSAAQYASGEARIAPLPGLDVAGFTISFGATLPGREGGRPTVPVEGLLAAAAVDGTGVLVVAYSPQDRFASVEEDVLSTLGAITRAGP